MRNPSLAAGGSAELPGKGSGVVTEPGMGTAGMAPDFTTASERGSGIGKGVFTCATAQLTVQLAQQAASHFAQGRALRLGLTP